MNNSILHKGIETQNVFAVTKIYTAFSAIKDKNYVFRGEMHNFWEIVMVLKGKIGVSSGSYKYKLEGGNAIIYSPMEYHSLWSEDKTRPEIIVISFNCKNMPEIRTNVFSFNSETLKFAKSVIKSFKSDYTYDGNFLLDDVSKNFHSQITVKMAELLILKLISHEFYNKTFTFKKSGENYFNILSVLEENIYNNLSLKQIAEKCQMSEANLKSVFSKYAKTGLKNYYNILIMNKAIELLNSGFSVYETAEKLNFPDSNYFSVAFKRIIGKSPSFFKK